MKLVGFLCTYMMVALDHQTTTEITVWLHLSIGGLTAPAVALSNDSDLGVLTVPTMDCNV